MNIILKNIQKLSKKQYIYIAIIAFCLLTSVIFVYNNHSLYKRPIGQVTEITLEEKDEVVDRHGNEDKVFKQQIIAHILNGENKDERVYVTNEYSSSGSYDHKYETGQEVFIHIGKNTTESGETTASITDLKRDKYLVIIAWVFILTLLLIGKRQGLFASVSLAVNIILLSYALDIYVNTSINLLWISGILAILFTVISLLLVNGFNEKTYAAIIATLLGTFFALFVAYMTMWLTNENGLRYEEMQFLTRPYEIVFLAGLFIGSLGAVMDVAISISSAMFELYHKNNNISPDALKKSGFDIGRDIMGTMTNILFFAYISGSIPTLILYLKNHSQLGFTLSINLSLELARALAGGIGIVITIPIGLYTTLYFIERKRAKS